MRSNIQKLMMTLVAVMMIAGAWAQASSPSMPDAIINLNKFNGNWQAKWTSTEGDKSYQFDYNVKCMPIAGGNGAYWEESGIHPAMGEIRSSDLFGYDRSDKKLHCFSVDNTGMTQDQICEWISPDHLVIRYNGAENGKQIAGKVDLQFTSNDMLDVTVSSMMDGKEQWSGSGTFHRMEDNK